MDDNEVRDGDGWRCEADEAEPFLALDWLDCGHAEDRVGDPADSLCFDDKVEKLSAGGR